MANTSTIKSVYGTDCLSVEGIEYVGPFIIQYEVVACGDDNDEILVEAAYTKEGYYMGGKEIAERLLARGVTDQLQPKGDGITCTIGFNPTEQKWYGWSHRGIYGFGIGSAVQQGDCAFSAGCPAEVEASLLEFWDLVDPYAWRECEDETVVCKHRLFRSVQTREDGELGWLVAYDTIFIGADRHSVHTHFEPYPAVWGKGAWTAKTVEDAKQMAIDFSEGVS